MGEFCRVSLDKLDMLFGNIRMAHNCSSIESQYYNQITDWFHVLKNLCSSKDKVLTRTGFDPCRGVNSFHPEH